MQRGQPLQGLTFSQHLQPRAYSLGRKWLSPTKTKEKCIQQLQNHIHHHLLNSYSSSYIYKTAPIHIQKLSKLIQQLINTYNREKIQKNTFSSCKIPPTVLRTTSSRWDKQLSAQIRKSLSPSFFTLNILLYEFFCMFFVYINSLETLFLTFVIDRVARSPKTHLQPLPSMW